MEEIRKLLDIFCEAILTEAELRKTLHENNIDTLPKQDVQFTIQGTELKGTIKRNGST